MFVKKKKKEERFSIKRKMGMTTLIFFLGKIFNLLVSFRAAKTKQKQKHRNNNDDENNSHYDRNINIDDNCNDNNKC